LIYSLLFRVSIPNPAYNSHHSGIYKGIEQVRAGVTLLQTLLEL